MKSTIIILINLFAIASIAFSQDDCPGREENEQFIEDFIKHQQESGGSDYSNQSNLQVNEIESDNYGMQGDEECWRLKWNSEFYPHIGNCGYDEENYNMYAGPGPIWDFNYDNQTECMDRLFSAMDEVDDNECARTAVNIYIGCEPCEKMKKYYLYENGNWIRKETDPKENTDKETSSLSPIEILQDSISIIPCGYLIVDIEKNGDNYNLIYKDLNDKKKSDEDKYKSKEKEEFIAALKKILEPKNQKKNIASSDQVQKNTLNEVAKDENIYEESKTEKFIDPENKTIQDSRGGPYKDYELNFEKDITKLKGEHIDFDNNGTNDMVKVIDKNGIEHIYQDDDDDGFIDKVTIRNPDHSAIIIIDSEYNGTYDEMVVFDENGAYQRYDFNEEPPDAEYKLSIDPNLRSLYTFNDDGNPTIVSPTSGHNNINSDQVNIFVNGVLNSNYQSVESAKYMANEFGVQFIDIYNNNNWELLESDPSFVMSSIVYDNLIDGKEVNIYAHSGGEAVTYIALINNVQNRLDQQGKGYLMRNATVVAFGAREKNWETSANVVYIINPGDLVATSGTSWNNHYFDSYKPWIEYISKHGINEAVLNQSKTRSSPPKND